MKLTQREHEILTAAFEYAKHCDQWKQEHGEASRYDNHDLELALANGANWADLTQWTATEEREPQQRGQYLAATKHGLHVAEYIPQCESNEIYPTGWCTFTGILLDVTHWRQLPTNPNERKGGAGQWLRKD